jgi:hypothetical protein
MKTPTKIIAGLLALSAIVYAIHPKHNQTACYLRTVAAQVSQYQSDPGRTAQNIMAQMDALTQTECPPALFIGAVEIYLDCKIKENPDQEFLRAEAGKIEDLAMRLDK